MWWLPRQRARRQVARDRRHHQLGELGGIAHPHRGGGHTVVTFPVREHQESTLGVPRDAEELISSQSLRHEHPAALAIPDGAHSINFIDRDRHVNDRPARKLRQRPAHEAQTAVGSVIR